jgi:hypothetical protein
VSPLIGTTAVIALGAVGGFIHIVDFSAQYGAGKWPSYFAISADL